MSEAPFTETHSAGRGRPRSERVDAAIIDAAYERLAAVGYEGLTVSSVAEAAGVGRPAIYRRYRSRADLAAAALSRLAGSSELELPAHPRSAIRLLLGATAASLSTPGAMTLLGSLLSLERRDPELMRIFRVAVFEPRQRVVRGVLDDAIAGGWARPDLDAEVVIDLLFGALMASALKGSVIDGDYLDRVVDSAWIIIRKEPA